VIAVCLVAAAAAGEGAAVAFTEVHMGLPVRITVHAPSEDAVRPAVRAAMDRVKAHDLALSDWKPDSAAMQLPTTPATVQVDDATLAEALDAASVWHQRTDGALDVTLGPLTRLWRAARRTGVWPSPQELLAARSASGMHNMSWNPADRTLTLHTAAMRLDFGGLAQGMAADAALRSLRESGWPSAIVDVSGDVAVGDAPPGAVGWTVQVTPAFPDQPGETLLLERCGISSSGDRGQPSRIGDRPAGHILDPANGEPLPLPRQAVVIAASATAADALATAFCVLSPEGCRAVMDGGSAIAVRLDRPSEEGGVQRMGAWSAIRRAEERPVAAPPSAEAAHPSPGPEETGPLGSAAPGPR
jgi:thiamine biosynthesis lipoprotein